MTAPSKLTVVSTDWCKFCKTTAPAVDAAEAALGDLLQVVRIDGDEDPDALTQHGGTTYPHLVLTRGGHVIGFRGSADEQCLMEWLGAMGVSR